MKQADGFELRPEVGQGRFERGRPLILPCSYKACSNRGLAIAHLWHFFEHYIENLTSLYQHLIIRAIRRLRGESKDSLFEFKKITKIEVLRSFRLDEHDVYVMIATL